MSYAMDQITLTLPAETIAELRRRALEGRVSMSAIVREALAGHYGIPESDAAASLAAMVAAYLHNHRGPVSTADMACAFGSRGIDDARSTQLLIATLLRDRGYRRAKRHVPGRGTRSVFIRE